MWLQCWTPTIHGASSLFFCGLAMAKSMGPQSEDWGHYVCFGVSRNQVQRTRWWCSIALPPIIIDLWCDVKWMCVQCWIIQNLSLSPKTRSIMCKYRDGVCDCVWSNKHHSCCDTAQLLLRCTIRYMLLPTAGCKHSAATYAGLMKIHQFSKMTGIILKRCLNPHCTSHIQWNDVPSNVNDEKDLYLAGS